MLVPVWVWKLQTAEDFMWLRFLVQWVPSGGPN